MFLARLLSPLVLLAVVAAQGEDPLYDKTRLRDFHFTFHQSNWWTDLVASATTNIPIKADLSFDGVTYKDVGIKVKGNTSSRTATKKPFNLSMDHFVAGRKLYGYKTVNLNNAWRDPTYTREVLTYDLMAPYLPTPQTAFARVYLNGKMWGVYVMAEQINADFLRHFYDEPNGVRFKGDSPTRISLGSSTLEYYRSGYTTRYELKTSQTTAWTQLANMIAKLDTGSVGNLEKDISGVINVDRALWYLATNNVVHNCDGYDTGGHNYYMYFDPQTGLMNIVPWDCNYSFAVFKFFLPTSNYVRHDPINLNSQIRGRRPLKERILMVPKWKERYLAHIRTILDETYKWDQVMASKNAAYQKLIDAAVQTSPNRLYSYTWFKGNITKLYNSGSYTIPGLKTLVDARGAFLRNHALINKPSPTITDVSFAPTTTQTPGSTIWIRAKVTTASGTPTVDLKTATLAHAPFAIAKMYDDGAHNDGKANDGIFGASFKSARAYETVRFFVEATNSAGAIKLFPRRAEFECLSIRTIPKRPTGGIMVNEVLADNETVDKDQAGDYEDWVELINNTSAVYDLSGHYLSDDIRSPKKWQFPSNTKIPAKGMIRVWCDNEPTEGPLHATFKLSDEGEEVVLSDGTGTVIDALFFDRQKKDRSFGSVPDGSIKLFHIFDPIGAAPLSGIGGGKVVRYDSRRSGNPSGFTLSSLSTAKEGNTVNLQLFNGPKSSPALVGLSLGSFQIDLGLLGPLLLDPTLMVTVGLQLDAFGYGGISLPLPTGTAGMTAYAQAAATDLSNAVVFTIAK